VQIGLLIESLDLLDRVAAWGYDYAEIVPWLLGPDADDPAAERAALDRVRSSPVPVATMCGFLPDPERLGLMVVGPSVDSARLRAYATRVFDRMQRAGVDVMGFGSGSARTVPAGFPPERGLAQVRDFLHMCADLAEPRGVRVAIEPYNREDTNLLYTVPEALAVARAVDRPGVRLMADLFHMGLNDEPFDDLIEAGPYLIHAHMAEPGRGRPPTTAADHARFLATLRRAGYDGRVTQTGPLPAYGSPEETAATLRRVANERAAP
jgi:sugar phosphate isomerase/epimerase